VVLDVNGEMLRPRLEWNPLRNRPARERAIALEAKVVVQAPGLVSLHDEDRLVAATARAKRLRRPHRIALPPVLPQALGHGLSMTMIAHNLQREAGDNPVDAVDYRPRPGEVVRR
jgi:hypothetical protein